MWPCNLSVFKSKLVNHNKSVDSWLMNIHSEQIDWHLHAWILMHLLHLHKFTDWSFNIGSRGDLVEIFEKSPIKICYSLHCRCPSSKCSGRTVVCSAHCRPTVKQYSSPTVRAVNTMYWSVSAVCTGGTAGTLQVDLGEQKNRLLNTTKYTISCAVLSIGESFWLTAKMSHKYS